jgi:Transient receptor potential (TRP) ion channel
MGVAFFVVNCVFAVVILLMVIWSSTLAIMSKNPDTRYKPMLDDRGSFMKSQSNVLLSDLDALGATARGETPYGRTEQKKFPLENESNLSSSNISQMARRTTPPGDMDVYSGSVSSHIEHGSSSPYPRRIPQQVRVQENGRPENVWQRGVGY